MRSIFVAVAVAVVALAAVAAADPSDIHRPIEMDGAFEHSFMDDISITIIDLIGKFGDFLRYVPVANLAGRAWCWPRDQFFFLHFIFWGSVEVEKKSVCGR